MLYYINSDETKVLIHSSSILFTVDLKEKKLISAIPTNSQTSVNVKMLGYTETIDQEIIDISDKAMGLKLYYYVENNAYGEKGNIIEEIYLAETDYLIKSRNSYNGRYFDNYKTALYYVED